MAAGGGGRKGVYALVHPKAARAYTTGVHSGYVGGGLVRGVAASRRAEGDEKL